MSKLYYRLNDGLNDVNYKFYPLEDSEYNHIKNLDSDHYKSIYYYTEEQVREAKQVITDISKRTKKTYPRIRGVGNITDHKTGTRYKTIEDVQTNLLVWDFDAKDTEVSRADTKTLVSKLKKMGIAEDAIQVSFSGGKGFSVVVETNEMMSPKEMKNICSDLAGDLDTFDTTVYNPSRIFRVPLTRHKSGLYKTPIMIETLNDYDTVAIKDIAKSRMDLDDISDIYVKSDLPKIILDKKGTTKEVERKVSDESLVHNINSLDWEKRLKFLTPEKFVLYNGLGYGDGQRHEVYMILASSLKSAGFSADMAYSQIKTTDRLHSVVNHKERFPSEEIWDNIIGTVFSNSWQGGTYGPGHPILAEISKQIPERLKRQKDNFVENKLIFNKFQQFAVNIEKNTIKSGIELFDKKIKLLTGTSIGILGIPGSGKTSLAMNILKNTSLAGEVALFFSLDMNESLIALKQIQQLTGYNNEKIYKIVKENPEEFEAIQARAEEVYKNIGYSFKFGLTPADIRQTLQDYEDKHGKKVRLMVIDYLENVQSGYNDPTVGSGIVAQQIANICADEEVLGVTLMQTQKAVKPGEPIESMRQIKGASVIEQSISVGIGISRPGQPLAYKDHDDYMVANILKNRFGPLGSIPMFFDGGQSIVRDLTATEKLGYESLLEIIKDDKEQKKDEEKKSWGGGF